MAGTSSPAYRCFSAGLDQLARALKNFSDSRRGKRKGQRVGFPRFKKRGKARDSFRYTTGAYGPADDRHVKLPRIGQVKTHEPMGALTGKLADGSARLLGATVSRTAGRWFVSYTVEVDREVSLEPSARQRRGGPVGVDLGVKHLAVFSTGETVANPKRLARSQRKLRKASRAYSRSKPGSAGRRQRAARLARIHARVAHQRRDGLHKLTTRLATSHLVVVVEDLTSRGWSVTGASPAPLRTRVWRRSAASSPTRPSGTARGSTSRTAGTQVREPAPAVAGETQA